MDSSKMCLARFCKPNKADLPHAFFLLCGFPGQPDLAKCSKIAMLLFKIAVHTFPTKNEA